MDDFNKRVLEVFRDMQRMKGGFVALLKSEDPRVVALSRQILEDTKSTFDWQYQFKKERGLDFDENH